jgi:kinesin family protein 22
MGGDNASPGLIPLSVEELFQLMQTKQQAQPQSSLSSVTTAMSDITLTCSFLEIYQEKVYDLLDSKQPSQDLPLRENTSNQLVVAGLTEKTVSNVNEFKTLYAAGIKARSTGATKLNAKSSRSHSVLTLKLSYKTVTRSGTQIQTKLYASKLHLIDLAGK